MDAILSDTPLQDAIVERQLEAVRTAAGEGLSRHAARLRRSDSRRVLARALRSVAFDFWQQFDAAEELEEIRLDPAVSVQGAAMIVNQWVPAAHRGDAIGDSARRMRDLLRAARATSRRSTR